MWPKIKATLGKLDRVILGPKPKEDADAARFDIRIAGLEQRLDSAGKASIWITTTNLSRDNAPVSALNMLLSYGVGPGGTYSPGGNGILSWKLDNKANRNAEIPANATSTFCVYQSDDPLELVWPDDTGNGRKPMPRTDYQWLSAELLKPAGLITLLNTQQDMWLEVRAPDWSFGQNEKLAKLCLS